VLDLLGGVFILNGVWNNMISLLFSGQGSQYVGMLKDYYENCESSKKIIDNADEILGYKLSDIMFNGPIEVLTETRYTQPALFVHSVVVLEKIKNNIDFSSVAGHSIGEYAALYASGVLSFEDALKLVSIRAGLMFEIGQNFPGTMFAVVGMDDEKLIELANQLNIVDDKLDKVIVPANFNSPGQVVISGSKDYLKEKAIEFKNNGAKIIKELNVSGAFHSPLMKPVKETLDVQIDLTNFNDAQKPVFVNLNAEKLTSSIEIKKSLKLQVVSSVLWTQILKNMQADGTNEFIEVGPSNVLQGLVKRTLTDVSISGFDKYSDLEKLV